MKTDRRSRLTAASFEIFSNLEVPPCAEGILSTMSPAPMFG